jgi:hypothetical protein
MIVMKLVFILALISLNMPAAFAGEGGRGADDVSRYLNLIEFYVVPDILRTVHPDDSSLKEAETKVRRAYQSFYRTLTQDPETLIFQRKQEPLKDCDGENPWICTTEEVGSPLRYYSKSYKKRFGDNYDVIVMTQHIFHEIGHWYQLPEDMAWQFAYTVTNAYVKKCKTVDGASNFLNGGSCQAFELVKRAEIKDGKPVVVVPRTLEKIDPGQSCLEGYFNSFRKLQTGIAAQNETADMVTQILNGERKDHVTDDSYIWGLLAQVATGALGLPVVALEPELFPAILFGFTPALVSPLVGMGVEDALKEHYLELNRQIDIYNKSVDGAVWLVDQYRASTANKLLLLNDREFTYTILSEALVGSTLTLKASVQNSDNNVMKINFSDKINIDEMGQRLKVLAESTELCAGGLPTAADLGSLTALSQDKGVRK